MATAGAPPFLAKAMRRFPPKNPPDRLLVFQKSRSRNEFRREHAGVRSFTPAAARARAPPPQARGRAGAPPRTGFIYSQSQRRNKVTRPIQAQGYSPAREVIRARMDLQSPVHASAAPVGCGDRAS